MSSKLLRRLLLLPVFLFVGLELILWIFVRIPLEPVKRVDLANDLPGLKPNVRLIWDRNLTRFADGKEMGGKPPGTVRILCIGGSSTFGLLQNAGDTWWGQLGSQLNAKGLAVQVAGWGQDRTGIVASTVVAEAIMEDWKPDVVIANFGFDDVVGQPLEYTYQPAKARSLPGPARVAGWKRAILQVSQTARLGRWWTRRNEAGQIQNNIGRTDYWKNAFATMRKQVSAMPERPLPPRNPPQDPMQEFLDGWKVLHELCQRQGAALVMTGEAVLQEPLNDLSEEDSLLALIPVRTGTSAQAQVVRPLASWVDGEMNRYAEAAAGFAAKAGLPWLNLNGRVPHDLEHFFSDVIFTDAGAVAAAEALLPVVEPVVRARQK